MSVCGCCIGNVIYQRNIFLNIKRLVSIRIVKSNVSSVGPSSERNSFCSDEGPMLETLDFTIRISSTLTFLYFDLYLYTAYATHNTFILFFSSYNGSWERLANSMNASYLQLLLWDIYIQCTYSAQGDLMMFVFSFQKCSNLQQGSLCRFCCCSN